LPALLLVMILGMAAGGIAVLGRVRWGNAGWYFHTDPDFRLRWGEEALRAGNPERVDQVIDALAASGHSYQASLLRGEELYRRGKAAADRGHMQEALPLLNQAEAEFKKIRDKNNLSVELEGLLGLTNLSQNRPGEAQQALEFVVSKRKDHVEAHRGLALLYYRQRALTKAITHLQRVAELDPDDGRSHRLMGLIYRDLKQYALAVDCYRDALERGFPDNNDDQHPARIRKELAECLVRLSRYDEALQVIEALDPLPADAAAVEALRVECLHGLNRSAEARKALEQGLADYAGCVELLRIGATLYLGAGEKEKALPLLGRLADNLDRLDFEGRTRLAEDYEHLGRKAEAAEQRQLAERAQRLLAELSDCFKEALDRPADAAIRLRIAKLCDELGRRQEAEQWRKSAADCPPARDHSEASPSH
jgi:tetratricopeptide (TPR) repeat protein